ncbi:MAG: V-type ATP synthase subunit E [Planctomycetota bacterium]|jgi:vacuolar-type H+-ATPase subunit E/Vma4
MESVEREKASLISGIETDARAEEERIVKEAETQAAEKRKYSEKKIESLLDEARIKAQEQAEAARKKIISAAEREVKRRSMRVRDEVMQDIMARVEEKLGSMIGGDNYRSALAGWLTEAAIGLDAEAAIVGASAEELRLIDDNMLSEVKGRFHNQTGKHVELTLSEDQPLQSQGVVLTAADGRTAFSNQVKTRMLRYKREIQTLIHSTLFADSKKE